MIISLEMFGRRILYLTLLKTRFLLFTGNWKCRTENQMASCMGVTILTLSYDDTSAWCTICRDDFSAIRNDVEKHVSNEETQRQSDRWREVCYSFTQVLAERSQRLPKPDGQSGYKCLDHLVKALHPYDHIPVETKWYKRSSLNHLLACKNSSLCMLPVAYIVESSGKVSQLYNTMLQTK